MQRYTRALVALVCMAIWLFSSPALSSNPVPVSPDVAIPIEDLPLNPSDSRPWSHVPNRCETFDLVWSEKRARYYHKRKRNKQTERDQDRTKEVIRLVAREMGAEPNYFLAKAMIESTHNSTALHVLNPDANANKAAWYRFTWSAEREAQLTAILERAGKQSKLYYSAKAELARRTRYKNNPYWKDTVSARVYGPKNHSDRQDVSIWAYGYGLYGMNAVGFTKYWGTDAPPWILCAHDGVVATIIQVWATRRGLGECVSQGYPRTYDTLNRRVSRGHCDEYDTGRAYAKYAEVYNVNRSGTPKLGTKWERDSSDRQELLNHMLRLVEEECLTEELFERKACTNNKATGYRRDPFDGPRIDGQVVSMAD